MIEELERFFTQRPEEKIRKSKKTAVMAVESTQFFMVEEWMSIDVTFGVCNHEQGFLCPKGDCLRSPNSEGIPNNRQLKVEVLFFPSMFPGHTNQDETHEH
jgi:hypothetical protein